MRFNLFSKKILQFKYLFIIVVAMVIPALVVGSFLYYFIFTLTAEQIGIPEAVAANLLPVVQKINYLLIMGLVPLFALLFFWGLVLSHRFCGPLERIEEDVNKILEGDYSVRFRVREQDDIKGIVSKLNQVMDILQSKKQTG